MNTDARTKPAPPPPEDPQPPPVVNADSAGDSGLAVLLPILLVVAGLGGAAWLLFGRSDQPSVPVEPAVPMICTCVPAPRPAPWGRLPHEESP